MNLVREHRALQEGTFRATGALVDIIGDAPMPRPDAYQRFWAYLREHDLKTDAWHFRCDARLQPLFSGQLVRLTEVSRVMSELLKPVGRKPLSKELRQPLGELARLLGDEPLVVKAMVEDLVRAKDGVELDVDDGELPLEGELGERILELDGDDPNLAYRVEELVLASSEPVKPAAPRSKKPAAKPKRRRTSKR